MASDKGRIILHPGYVTSKTDGERHYIGAGRLADLYGVNIIRCVILARDEDWRGFHDRKGDHHLYPREDGNYAPINPR